MYSFGWREVVHTDFYSVCSPTMETRKTPNNCINLIKSSQITVMSAEASPKRGSAWGFQHYFILFQLVTCRVQWSIVHQILQHTMASPTAPCQDILNISRMGVHIYQPNSEFHAIFNQGHWLCWYEKISLQKPQLMACLVNAYSWLECGAMWCSDVVKWSSKPVLQIEMELCDACFCLICSLCLFVCKVVRQPMGNATHAGASSPCWCIQCIFFTYIHWHCVCMSTDWCLHVLLLALEKKRFIVSIPAHVLVLFVSVFGHIYIYMFSVLAVNNTKQVKHT